MKILYVEDNDDNVYMLKAPRARWLHGADRSGRRQGLRLARASSPI